MTAVIRLEDIMKTYVMGDAVVHALDHVSVEIGVGEFTSIMGPSGSGKSTMMNILGCLDRPTSGQYYLDGKEVAGYSDDELARTRNAKIGFVFQNFNLLPKLSAQLNVVAIARSLVNDPAIIMADEPTGNLDTKSSYEIMDIFKKMNDNGKTVVMVTHEPDIAEQTKRILTMRDGKLVSDEWRADHV